MRTCELTNEEFEGPGYLLKREDGQPCHVSREALAAVAESPAATAKLYDIVQELADRVERLERGPEPEPTPAPKSRTRKAGGDD